MSVDPPLESLTATDRRTLLFGPLWMFSLVAGSDGSVDEREVDELARVVEQSRPEGGPLLASVLAELTSQGAAVLAEYATDDRGPEEGLRRLAAVVDVQWRPSVGDAFKDGILAIGKAVAEASGGFLGLGDRTSWAESEALATATRCLGRTGGSADAPGATVWPPVVP